MATDAASLLAQSACLDCNGAGPGELELMKIALLAQLVLGQNPMADVTPQGLLNQAACYNCYGGGGMWQLMQIALLVQLVNAGIGNGQLVGFTGNDPNSAGVKPLNQNAPAVAVNTTQPDTIWTWNVNTKVWN